MMDAETRTASYYDQTAPAYDGQMEGAAVTALRDAFRERVAAVTPRGGTILDFGCGTGIDAEWYAARGFRVIAYDISAGMVDQLRRRCESAVAARTVTPLAGPWDVLARHLRTVDPVDTVAANFAVLNHFADLGAALRQFTPYLAAGGAVVASLLSPFHLRDVRRRWWWAAALRARGRGALTVHGAVTTHRFLPGTLRRAAAPEFALAELLGIESDGDASALGPMRPRTLLRAQFWLALWRKQ
jgi:SAM-dependent methyltransferase